MPLKDNEPREWEFDCPTPEGTILLKCRFIRSSNVKWIGWPRTVVQSPLLFVEFNDGLRYVYLDVTRQQAVAAAYAESTGKYLAEHIIGKKTYHRLR